jgi:hypothetical protein
VYYHLSFIFIIIKDRIIMDCIENYCSLRSWPEKREIYDHHGEETLKEGIGVGGAAQNNPFEF